MPVIILYICVCVCVCARRIFCSRPLQCFVRVRECVCVCVYLPSECNSESFQSHALHQQFSFPIIFPRIYVNAQYTFFCCCSVTVCMCLSVVFRSAHPVCTISAGYCLCSSSYISYTPACTTTAEPQPCEIRIFKLFTCALVAPFLC